MGTEKEQEALMSCFPPGGLDWIMEGKQHIQVQFLFSR